MSITSFYIAGEYTFYYQSRLRFPCLQRRRRSAHASQWALLWAYNHCPSVVLHPINCRFVGDRRVHQLVTNVWNQAYSLNPEKGKDIVANAFTSRVKSRFMLALAAPRQKIPCREAMIMVIVH